jgi:[acyl-carrier-protein] S-malonyltransferase
MSTAFVFSGQGNQYVGMGRGVVDAHPVAQQTWAEADHVLGFSLSRLVKEGPEQELTLTENAQPAILAYSVALLRVLGAERPDCVPSMAAGHSLGEYSALVAAGSLSYADALRLVRLRGQAMQEAVAPGVGGMLAVMGLSPEQLQSLCAAMPNSGVEVAAFNSPVQSVLAGPLLALKAFQECAEAAGARQCVSLKVSAPFHTQMLRSAGERLRVALDAVPLEPPRFPVFQNVDASTTNSPEEIKEKLVQQVSMPVRWVDCVEVMRAKGATHFVELGPGRSLTGLIKKCDRKLDVRFTDRSAFLEQF